MIAATTPRQDLAAVRAGDERALIVALLALVQDWHSLSGHSGRHPTTASQIAALGGAAAAGLLAAAVDLRDLVGQSPKGRQALRDLGFQPFLEHVEGE